MITGGYRACFGLWGGLAYEPDLRVAGAALGRSKNQSKIIGMCVTQKVIIIIMENGNEQ